MRGCSSLSLKDCRTSGLSRRNARRCAADTSAVASGAADAAAGAACCSEAGTEAGGAAPAVLAGLALPPSDLLLVPAAIAAAVAEGGALSEGEAEAGSGGKILAINATT